MQSLIMQSYSSILSNEQYIKLANFYQHKHTTRYQHSINVALLARRIANLIGANEEETVRSSLLHDFFFYDWRTEHLPQMHAWYHPKNAVKNAEKFFNLTEVEKQAMLSHMWPLGPLPKSRVAWCLTIADKICAVEEFLNMPAVTKMEVIPIQKGVIS